MDIDAGRIRSHRLRAHHLEAPLPPGEVVAAAGACGLQNTPPGAWETACFNRLQGCALPALEAALYDEKTLLQAWSFRGAPVVFPAAESGVFLTPLIAQEGEWPWVYTLGITGVLDHMQMPFDDLLARVMEAAAFLDDHTVKSKEALDAALADIVCAGLPAEKQALWQAPSIYGRPDRQTMGGAAVSFLLRPCAFHALVVFGRRQGASPTFTSLRNWTGRPPRPAPGGERALVRKFLHCYGPARVEYFADWLGCSPRQAKRLWAAAAEEMEPVKVGGRPHYVLADDVAGLRAAECDEGRLRLLGAHDPYLDLRDRAVVLEDKARHKAVWQYVANPGAVLRGGQVAGTWRVKTQKDRLEVAMGLWEAPAPAERKKLEELAEGYAAFRGLGLKSCAIEVV